MFFSYEAYQLASLLQEESIPVVMGGLHVTALPKEAKQYCDSVIIGEGELSWQQVIEDAEAGQLKPFYGSVKEEFNLENAPMPAFELLDIDNYNRLTIQTSRCCVHRCEFCASSVLLTPRYKQKPIEKVLAEIDRIKTIWKHPFIELADDNSFVNRQYWEALLPEIKQRNIRWFTETDISISQDPGFLQLLRESGCAQVLIGFEAVSGTVLNGLETKHNWKAEQAHIYKEAIDSIQSSGISVNGCFILGLDEHDLQAFDQVYEFVDVSGLHEVQITIQTPFPGTSLYTRLNKDGRLLDKTAWQMCTLFDINFKPKKMTVKELSDGFKRLSAKLYSDEFTNQRRKKFKKQLRRVVAEKLTA